jgi:hypothetical protein
MYIYTYMTASVFNWYYITKKRGWSLPLSFLEAVLLALVEQVRLAAAQVDDLRTAIAIFLLHRALLAVVRV